MSTARAILRLRAPATEIAAWSLLLAVAVLGVSAEIVQTFKAVSAVDDSEKEMLLALGMSHSLVPLRMALLAALALLPIGLLAAHRQVPRHLTRGDLVALGLAVASAALALWSAATLTGFMHDFGMLAGIPDDDPRLLELAGFSPDALLTTAFNTMLCAGLALTAGIAGLVTANKARKGNSTVEVQGAPAEAS